MEYFVSVQKGIKDIEFESLPVAKITHYPLEKKDYKPYAQASLGINENSISLSLRSFEVKPSDHSKIGAVLFPFSDDTSLEIWATPINTLVYAKDSDGNKKNIDFKVSKKFGEDLQGIYWGYDIIVYIRDIKEVGVLNIEVGSSIKGNFYKVQSSPKEHYGSYFPVNWESPYSKDEMTSFKLVSY